MPGKIPDTATICDKVCDLDGGLEIWRISPLRLREQDRNARVQSQTIFKSLVANVKKRGQLESLPFCHRDAECNFWLISGHHRVRGAVAAELTSIYVLVDANPLTRSEVVAKQLAHNSINGTDDSAVVLQLLQEIESIDAMIEASVNRTELEKAVKQAPKVPDIAADFDWRILTIAFLPKQVDDFSQLCDRIGESSAIGVADVAVYESFVETMKRLGKTEDIRSVGAILYRMMQITAAHLDAMGACEYS